MNTQMGLFSTQDYTSSAPLAYRLRPQSFEDFIGQNKALHQIKHMGAENITHLIFYGPPGSGKTTLAHLLAQKTGMQLFSFNAVLGGVPELRKIIQEATHQKEMTGKACIIFIDEIHRFNKSQQDALLPYLEEGQFILLGATTEYPQTTLNKAILSRVRIVELVALTKNEVLVILKTANSEQIDENILSMIADYSNGDARAALNHMEFLLNNPSLYQEKELSQIRQSLMGFARSYDKNSDRHYDVISAFIKSVRGSDVDAAMLWLAVMLEGGEDIEFIARRLIILASEDIGNADPRGLQMATSAHYAIKQIGMPEARIILAQVVSFLCFAPKSNASYLAIDKALDFVKNNPTVEVPTHLRNHHPDKAKYTYPHDYPLHWVKQDYKSKGSPSFYSSSGLGHEKLMEENKQKMQKGLN